LIRTVTPWIIACLDKHQATQGGGRTPWGALLKEEVPNNGQTGKSIQLASD
jgi:hypothetical protein